MLGLSAGEGGAEAVKGKVVEADLIEEVNALTNLFENLSGDAAQRQQQKQAAKDEAAAKKAETAAAREKAAADRAYRNSPIGQVQGMATTMVRGLVVTEGRKFLRGMLGGLLKGR